MKVVELGRDRLPDLAAEPLAISRLQPATGGLHLGRPDLAEVPFERIRAASVCRTDRFHLLLLLHDFPRPLSAAAPQIRFRDFPFPLSATAMNNLRGLLFYLVKQCPALVLDEGTFSFLEGTPLPRIDKVLSHATALCAAVAPDGLGRAPARGTGQ